MIGLERLFLGQRPVNGLGRFLGMPLLFQFDELALNPPNACRVKVVPDALQVLDFPLCDLDRLCLVFIVGLVFVTADVAHEVQASDLPELVLCHNLIDGSDKDFLIADECNDVKIFFNLSATFAEHSF